MKTEIAYHHGHLREELLRLGLEALESEGAEEMSLRSLAGRAGVSKTAPYRHFKDKESFLGALADEGFRLLCVELERAGGTGRELVSAMGRRYMNFAVARPALYRLMNSPLVCRIPDGQMVWARKSLMLLAGALGTARAEAGPGGGLAVDEAASTWAYIHGLVLIRIDGLFPADVGQPDWDRLASVVPSLG